MEFAPVIIPTLNRYEHLKRCLESLERCKDAKYTDVYVGLDYPPSEVYIDGWQKIDAYLRRKEELNGFRHLYVQRHEKNLGAVQNYTELRIAVAKYGYYIFTEDDNEFSPCFLSYMNQNLRLYKDDKTIFRICGYLPSDNKFITDYTQFRANRHVAWGIGEWVDKYLAFNGFIENKKLLELIRNKRVQEYFERNKMESILYGIVKMSNNNKILEDFIVAAYLVYNNMRCILPTKSMVRNHGFDGSGLHCGYSSKYTNQEIQDNIDYIMKEAPIDFTNSFERNMQDSWRKNKRGIKSMMVVIKWYVYKYLKVFIS